MRSSFIIAVVVLCAALLSAHRRAALAQPYQKGWGGPSQRGSGTWQKRHGHAPGAPCQQPCYPPCHPPCEPDQPKDAVPEPNQPRSAVPGVAPGAFVTPPQSGVIEGPSRGFEIGNVSLTLPELRLGLPRLRWEGGKRLSRDARMMTDKGAAPYVSNPYYATAVAQSQTRSASRDATRGAKPDDDADDKDAKKDDSTTQKDAAKAPCQADLELRLQRLENCFDQLNSCIDELKALRSAESAYQKSSAFVPRSPSRSDFEARSDIHIPPPRPLPKPAQVVFSAEAKQTNYEVYVPENAVPRPVPLRRLPTVPR